MAITMVVSLYTSRIILNTLGVEDFGIYNLVGGVVVLFSFLNNAMTASTQRFLNYEMSKNSYEAVRRVFSVSMNAHIMIIAIIVLLSETVGLWFLNSQLNIPQERMYAANVVYQFSILSFSINILKVPYNASIIAYEKMSFYAWISIIEVILKLVIVFLLVLFSIDKLILYSILTVSISFIIYLTYRLYSRKKYISCRYQMIHDKVIFKDLVGFSSWSLLGSLSVIGANQGVSMILNIFVGVVANAAIGVANQVSSALYSFVSNFQLAFQPQVIKTYAANEIDKHKNLVFQSSKFSYYLLLIIVAPFLINTEAILTLWLKIVPDYAVSFTQIILLVSLIDAISGPFWMSANAIGNIKKYQIGLSIINLLSLPFTYLFLYFGLNPSVVLIVRFFTSVVAFIYRFNYTNKRIKLNHKIIKKYLLNISSVSIIVFGTILGVAKVLSPDIEIGILTISSLGIILFTLIVISLLGLDNKEKSFLKNKIFKKLSI